MATRLPAGPEKARLILGQQEIELPVVVGTEGEHAIDIAQLRALTGYVTYDDGYRNTGACQSAITFIDGERGILRYRGIPIEQLAEHSDFIEVALLLIHGELPTADQLARFHALMTEQEIIHEGMRHSFEGFPPTAHPMAILSAMINTLYCYESDMLRMEEEQTLASAAARLLAKIRTVAAAAYKTSVGEPPIYPEPHLDYCANFLHMMFSIPYKRFEPDPDIVKALSLFLMLHADHEQNCSTATVRMVGSSGANLFASCAAGVCALWGSLHGGANIAVIEQLERIHRSGLSVEQVIERVKRKEERLSGFGHDVYRSYDPRAKILRGHTLRALAKVPRKDPLLDIARRLEEVALNDDYFTSRSLYPNLDFYSAILLRAMGIPTNMYTVVFAIGRMPGWIAQWKELRDKQSRIYRPRQIYVGAAQRDYIPLNRRAAPDADSGQPLMII
jgi:citrate synthase